MSDADGSGDAETTLPWALVAGSSQRGAQLEQWLTDLLPVDVATSLAAAREKADRNLSVAVLCASVSPETKEAIIETVSVRSPFARTIVVPQDDQPPMLEGPGYDLCLYRPLERAELRGAVTSLGRVATYERTVSTYFEYTKLAANHRIGRSADDLAEDEAFQELERTIDRLQARLERMRDRLSDEEWQFLLDSLEDDEAAGFSGEVTEAPHRGQPDECNSCGLDWTVDHGGELGEGYERLGAFVWKCERCGAVQQASDPSHQWVA